MSSQGAWAQDILIDENDPRRAGVIVRFAPSPNGFLHLGHAYSALKNFELARESGGRFLLRIEDIDIGRARDEYADAILEDLAWLGLSWEEPVRQQSQHLGDYAMALERLAAMDVTYSCFCSRSGIAAAVRGTPGWPRDPDGAALYPGACRTLNASERARKTASHAPVAQRLDMAAAISLLPGLLGWREYGESDQARDISAQPAVWGDAVIGRKDVPGSYHIAVVVDDALQGVSDVVRGMDLFETTSLHRLLQELLGYPAPNYRHHKLILDAKGEKLSKSAQSKSLRELRREGSSAEDIRRQLGFKW
ncbi:MAG: tRNA glutamyl-Q(34) synthetase GluQRS [Alphaproteobacteria bacterium]|nr:tRNA glutamyl-Q(34) synthetase GluQRS [Alphaproteobacteria bacterium]